MPHHLHTVVVGGGIAGLSVAWQLSLDGRRRVTLLEREALPGTHSSARNAQIWLPMDPDETTGPLALRSQSLMSGLLGSEAAWLNRSGAVVLVPDLQSVSDATGGAARGGLEVRLVSRERLASLSPVLERRGPADDEPALFVEGAGIFDPHAMIGALVRACRDHGVQLATSTTAERIVVKSGAVRGVALEGGTEIASDEVVLAAGAWAGDLGRGAGADVGLVPLRRHLVLLDADPRRASITVCRFGRPEVYFRPESGGVLASPCDEEPCEPSLPKTEPAALERLAEALRPIAVELVDAPVRTSWACLRTFAHDRELLVGPDPRVEGLAWLAGLGGRGMTVGVGAGALCADAVRGGRDRLITLTRPDRPQPERLRRSA